MPDAILLIAHGSRRSEANADLLQVAEELQRKIPAAIVEYGYLELAAPSIPEGLSRCVERGASSIRILPYFLSAGSHVTKDLENNRAEFSRHHPDIPCHLSPPIGLHPAMIEILLDRLTETLTP